MALNFSHRPIFSAHIPEDNLGSQMRIANGYIVDGVPDLNGDGFAKQWHSNSDVQTRTGSQDSAAVDIHDLLPSDPFGMDISTRFTAITGWHEDLDYVDYGRNEIGIGNEKYKLFAGLNFIWNSAMRFHEFPWSIGFNKSLTASGMVGDCDWMLGAESYHGAFLSSSSRDAIFSFENDNLDSVEKKNNGMCTDGDIGAPHPALSFALGYLDTEDLLRVSGVCKSLHSVVHEDPLLWKHVHIEQPLSEKITDDILMELTDRAQGTLHCLSLIECPRVTEDGLKRVLESNPKLTKLSVPGCTRINIEGILNSLRALKSNEKQSVKHLRIGGLYGLTPDRFEELKFLLGMDKRDQRYVSQPHFYIGGNLYMSCEDNCAIDVEMCPRCQNLRLVYDCPVEGCKGNKCSLKPCRGCILCIQRCVQCGRCINDDEYEETFCLEYLCIVCWKQTSNCQNKTIGPSTNDANDMDVDG